MVRSSNTATAEFAGATMTTIIEEITVIKV
jgi:hypothetical protein